jgi:hypothetical protein
MTENKTISSDDQPLIKVLPNEILLAEVRKFVDEGRPVTLRVKGNSMLPFIYGGHDNVRFIANKHYQVGDIALAEVAMGKYVVHRIIAIDGEKVTLMGDGNVRGTEHCLQKHLVAKVDQILRDDMVIDPYSQKMRREAAIWWKVRGVRRWILAVLRRTTLRNRVQKL